MYCKKCGNYIANGIDKCPMCGWVVGEEIVEEEKPVEVVEKEKLDISRFIFDLIGLVFVILVAFTFLTYKFISKNGDGSEAFYYISNKFKEASLFDAAKNYKDWFKGVNSSDGEAFVLFKIVLSFITLALCAFYVIVFVLNAFKIFIKKEEGKESLPILSFVYGCAITGYYSYAKPRVLMTFIFTVLIITIFICNIVKLFKKKEIVKGILPFAIISIILVYLSIYLLQLKLFEAHDDYFSNAEFVYLVARADKIYDVKTLALGSAYVNIIVCLALSVIPLIFIGLKKESKINSLCYFMVALPIINLLIGIFGCIQLQKKNYYDGMKVNVVFIFATILAVLSGILCVVAFISNYKAYKKTKVYNL